MTNQPHHEHGVLKRFLFFLKFLEIRLRFVAILVITALVVGYWDYVQNYYERWQRTHAPAQTAGGHAHPAAAEAGEGDFEYYCPMHPFVVRDHKDKCPICGMDLSRRKKGAAATLPEGTLARVQVSPERIMQAGVQVEPVGYRLLAREVRSYGTIEPDEQKLAKIVARFPGRVDKLNVNAVGMTVKKDEPLASIYSPKFLAASQEYLQALGSQRRLEKLGATPADEKRRAAELTEFARQRLLLAGFTTRQLDDIARGDKINESVTLYSPLAGTVLEKNVLQGETVEEGTALYTIADLSTLWVQAYVSEAELAAVKLGMPVEVTTQASPGKIFYGTVDFIYPTVNAENRAGKVRIVITQPEGKLKPGMVATVVLRSPLGELQIVAEEKKNAAPPAKDAKGGKKGKEKATAIKLPTTKQDDADRYLATLAPGAEYYTCSMDPDVVSDKPGDCPKCGMRLETQVKASGTPPAVKMAGLNPAEGAGATSIASAEEWAEGWACPMHPDALTAAGGICDACACGMPKQHLRVQRVPAIPETAVIDTGTRQVVYTESMPGVYDARAVTLGPRSGAWYPLLDGLKPGERIVARGAFLVDAEARLNPATAAAPSLGAPEVTPAAPANPHAGMPGM